MNEILFSTTNDGISKATISSFAEAVVSNVTGGLTDPLKLEIKLKAIEKAIDLIRTGIKDKVLTEAEKHGKSFTLDGVDVQVAELGTKYDFSECNDEEWNEWKMKEDQASTNRKLREMFLKSIKGHVTITDDDSDGTHWKVYEPKKKSTTGLKMTFK